MSWLDMVEALRTTGNRIMPRRPRFFVPGMPCHIIQRGHNRSSCFNNNCDYLEYLRLLEQQADDKGCAVHAYVLMTNHIHLLVTPEHRQSVSMLMKNLNQQYVQYFNRKYDRSGSLWEGRFKSCVTQTDNYVLACYRYIEMNPVRAKMVRHPVEYRWSSHSVNVGAKDSSLVAPHASYLALGHSPSERRAVYERLVSEYLDDVTLRRIRKATQSNSVFGSAEFEDRIWGQTRGSDPGV